MKYFTLSIIAIIFMFQTELLGQNDSLKQYFPFKNYHSNKDIYTFTTDEEFTYFGTDNGIIVYSNFTQEWFPPVNEAQNLFKGPVYTLLYHPFTGYLWASNGSIIQKRTDTYWTTIPLDINILQFGFKGDQLFIKNDTSITEIDAFTGFMYYDTLKIEPDSIQWSIISNRDISNTIEIDDNYRIPQNQTIQADDGLEYPILFSEYDAFSNSWIGSSGGGLFYNEKYSDILLAMPFGLDSDEIREVFYFEDKLFLFHKRYQNNPEHSSGISIINSNFQHFKWLNLNQYFEDIKLFTGLSYSNDTLIISTDEEILYINNNYNLIARITPGLGLIDSISGFLKLDNQLIIKAKNGLFFYNLSKESIKPFFGTNNILNTNIKKIQLRNESLFSLLDSSLITSSLAFSADSKIHELNEASVDFDIFQDSLYILGKTSIQYFNINHDSNSVTLIIPDSLGIEPCCIRVSSTHIWLGTNSGLWNYEQKQNKWHRLSEIHGLPSYQIQCLDLRENILYIGTGKGLGVYHIDSETPQNVKKQFE